MKTQSQVSEGAAEAVVNAAVKAHGKQVPAGATSKRQSQRDKATGKGVTKAIDEKTFMAEGVRDAKVLMGIEDAADSERVNLFRNLSRFAGYGLAAGDGKAKKAKFHAETEAYFKGWDQYRDTLPDERKGTVNVRKAEARRIVFAYIVKGAAWVNEIFDKKIGYHQKLKLLPTMTKRPAKQTKGEGEGEGDGKKKPTLADVKEDTARLKIIAQYSEKEITEIMRGLPEPQLWIAAAAFASRCVTVKDKALRELGKQIKKLLKADEAQAKAA